MPAAAVDNNTTHRRTIGQWMGTTERLPDSRMEGEAGLSRESSNYVKYVWYSLLYV